MLAVVVLVIIPGCMFAQGTPSSSTNAPSDKSVMAELVALRDSFVDQIRAEGFEPSLPPPEIILDDEPSYGAYSKVKNTVHVAAWGRLDAKQQAQFAGLFGQGQPGDQAFEETVHRWVFTHELGHWWQACQRKSGGSHYSEEYGASRIASAYWRLKDAIFMDKTAKRIAAVRVSLQNLVPEEQQSESYFNENYEKLAATPGFLWFQCDMVSRILAERPLPSFRRTLQ